VDVFDVWDNMEDMETFGKVLIPILESLKLELAKPDIQEIFGN